jgi:hypothetical protein
MNVRTPRLVALGSNTRDDYQATDDGISARLRLSLSLLV